MGVGFAEWFNWSSERDERLANQFYRHIDPADLAGRNPETVVGAVTHQIAVAGLRRPGEAVVRVTNPTTATHGWTCGRSVLSIVTDDMPFLVDSVSAELNRLGVGIHLVVHPIVAVTRAEDGTLRSAEPPESGVHSEPVLPESDVNGVLESWMHVEVDWQPDQLALDTIEANVIRVLGDVRRAVADWPRMVAEARGLAAELVATPPRGVGDDQLGPAIDLLNWLAADHFTFLGYRRYRLVGGQEDPQALGLVEEPGSGLGLLRAQRAESASFAELPPTVRRKALEPRLLIFTKANRRSTVHRPVYLDYVGIKDFDRAGRVVGEHRFIGLLSALAYTQSVETMPVVSTKVRAVREALGFSRGSHGGRDLTALLENFPRDELFAIDAVELTAMAEATLNLKERRATRLFVRHDTYERFLSCLVYLPRDRYTTDVRLQIQQVLLDAVGGDSVDYTARVTESVLARLHIVVRVARGESVPDIDVEALEARIAEVVRSWEDELSAALVAGSSEAGAHAVLRRFPDGFPEAYRAVTPTAEAVADLAEIGALTAAAPLRVALRPVASSSGERANARLKLYSLHDISLAQVLPVLSSMGVQVVTEQPFRLARTDGRGHPGGAFIFDFGLRTPRSARMGQVRTNWEQAFLACWDGRAETDELHGLVAEAGLDWRRISVLRAYVRYLRQIGSTFSDVYIQRAALANPRIASLLSRLFDTRFDPDLVGDRARLTEDLHTQITRALDDVASLDQDRILRSILALIMATVRTNHFQAGRPALAVKLEPGHIRDLPEPRPRYEIWVCSPRVEGVHLRFGKVARGGLRWSDRREDFRTEVLGLVKAQAVKNSVIVPVGAKGGFFAKCLPDPSVDREAWLAEGIEAYKVFIGSMLDLTDNRVGTQAVAPERVVRHDGDDPYLVVAADKGTAKFSDIANEVARQYGFWLGDAFASGGSAGYDHKAMGITARGAWESVKAHFRVIGPDIATSTFTAVGIGDMSGDVFGNGMLLSANVALVAAFDHRHIFLDPDPDPAVSLAERQRLFALPRSSWADYSTSLISEGGGVIRRTAKTVPISPQVAAALGLPSYVPAMSPNDLLRAILTAKVDLLWNGGIGTYVKAATESHADVGDRANDAIRVNGRDLRARVVGEGGNLGLTQRGRVEAARAGVALNTDAIDNSAGVDTSDHEVNIKILLDLAAAAGELAAPERDPLLASMTDEVAARVLADNIDQNIMLTVESGHGAAMLPALGRLMRALESSAGLVRALEALPDDSGLAALGVEGLGLTRPELAVLVAYTKLDLKEVLLAGALPDEPFTEPWLVDYFPEALAQRFAANLDSHPLRRQIITTGLVNELVNRGGVTYAQRATEESGAGPAEIARAFAVSTGIFGLRDLWLRIDNHEGTVPNAALNSLRNEVSRLLDRSTRWLLQTRGGTLEVPDEITRFRGVVQALAGDVPGMLVGIERERLERRIEAFVAAGVPAGLASEVATMLDLFSLLDIVEIALSTDEEPRVVAQLYFTISERYELDRFLSRITALPRRDRWSTLARAALRSDLYGALASLTAKVVSATPEGGAPIDRAAAWEQRHAEGLGRAQATLAEIGGQENFDLATLSVALRVIRTLAMQGG